MKNNLERNPIFAETLYTSILYANKKKEKKEKARLLA